MTLCDRVLEWLPYSEPFLFVDGFDHIDENGASGHYTFRHDQSFYQGHFPGNPVTPGVILIETMAQIGLVGLGMYLELLRRTGRSEPKESESLPSTDNSDDGSGDVVNSHSVRELQSLSEFAFTNSEAPGLAFTESEVAFLHPVLPGQTVFVRSEKIYFRLGKLKCRVEMFLREGSENTVRVCKGRMSGMILPPPSTRGLSTEEGHSTEQGISTEQGRSTEQDRSTES